MCMLINWSKNWLVAVAKCTAAVVRYHYIGKGLFVSLVTKVLMAVTHDS